ncbi:MAG: branched-chain amino acid ABC transporter substrate-binding protein [SAR324 cluster bacterium]|nr:branched-chain amino acid ABC transporter substrate-binding protein [SAR324 cluster bacterium]
MKRHILMAGALGVFFAGLILNTAFAAETVRLGLIEPFSGPVAVVGIEAADNFEYAAEQINKRGGVLGGRRIEIVRLDNAMSAEKTTQQIKRAIDQGIRFISQGIGSNHALNIIKALNKHNRRNPGQSILYLNHSAVTTAFTNELCSFWHFRFDANVDMKVAGLTTQMGRDPSIKKVYMINQNYAYGKSFQAAGRRMIKSRTQATLVGDDLILPFGKLLDFTPYVAKIQSSGADTVLTGNWGPDLIRLVNAVAEAGLKVQFYTVYGGIPSSVNGYGAKNGIALRIKQITESHENDDDRADVAKFARGYKAKYKRTWFSDRQRMLVEMFATALNRAGTDDPKAVAYALEGMTFPGPHGQTVTLRKADHQIIMPLVVSTIDPNASKKFIYADKNFGIGWQTNGWVKVADLTLKTTCKMKRPRR